MTTLSRIDAASVGRCPPGIILGDLSGEIVGYRRFCSKPVEMLNAVWDHRRVSSWSTLCAWHQTRDGIVSTFGRQALPMVWDYAEANPSSA